MIISYRHKYIFVHCRKTAGSSIVCALSESLGPWDIQLSAIQETLLSGRSIPMRMLMKAMMQPNALAMMPMMIRKKRAKLIANNAKAAFRPYLGLKPQHACADQIRNAFPMEWAGFSKFCVVRNPFDLAVSDYFWRTRHLDNPPSFERYVEALSSGDSLGGIVPVDYYSNWPRYTINDKIAMDKVIRFENLLPELNQYMLEIGVPFSGELPRMKSTHRPRTVTKTTYRDRYSKRARQLVEQLYGAEIEAFDYQF